MRAFISQIKRDIIDDIPVDCNLLPVNRGDLIPCHHPGQGQGRVLRQGFRHRRIIARRPDNDGRKQKRQNKIKERSRGNNQDPLPDLLCPEGSLAQIVVILSLHQTTPAEGQDLNTPAGAAS